MTDQTTKQELYIEAPQAEAGFSASWQMRDTHGQPVTLTMRALSAGEWRALLGTRAQMVETALKSGWALMSEAPRQSPQATVPASAPALESPHGAQSTTPVTDFDTDGLYCTEVARVVCRPEPGDKVSIEFYEDGHKFADFKVGKAPLVRAGGLMKHVAHLVDITRAVDVSVRLNVWWKYGNEYTNQKGETKRYRDVMHVRAA